MKPGQPVTDLPALAAHLRNELESKKAILLYAYNGTGKTRLSMAFKDAGKKTIQRPFSVGDHVGQPLTITETVGDTLYFNAFTEDLFHWDNDLDGDSDRKLTLNADSRFFAGLDELEMDNRIRPLLQRYADFDFRIDTQGHEWAVRFSRTVDGQVSELSRLLELLGLYCKGRNRRPRGCAACTAHQHPEPRQLLLVRAPADAGREQGLLQEGSGCLPEALSLQRRFVPSAR